MFKNPFRKTYCPTCGARYEEDLGECPKCGTKNIFADASRKHSNMTFLRAVKHIILFGLVFIALQIAASVVETVLMGIFVFQNGAEDIQLIEDYLSQSSVLFTINFSAYLIIFALLILFLWRELGKILKSFTKIKNVLFGILGAAVIIGLDFGYSALISLIPLGQVVNQNQLAIEEMVISNPTLSIICFCFISTFVEEIGYRVGLFGFLRRWNRPLAYVISALIFGFAHFSFEVFLTGDTNLMIIELLNIPSYVGSGFALAFLYEQFGLAGSLTTHILNNLFSCIMIFVTK